MINLFSVTQPERETLLGELERTLYSGYVGQGPRVEDFERTFGGMINNRFCLATNSCTSAIHLALKTIKNMGIDKGTWITSPVTCLATNLPLLLEGFDILWGDVDPKTGNLDPYSVEKLLETHKNISGIMVVHWGGQSYGSMSAFRDISYRYGLPIIEDCAHGFMGSDVLNEPFGMYRERCNTFTCFSFGAIKHINTGGDGGMLVCPDKDTFEMARLLRWYGISRTEDKGDMRCEVDVKLLSTKYNMNDVSAVIGLCQLSQAGSVINRFREIALRYDYELPSLQTAGMRFPQSTTYGSWWLYTLRMHRYDRNRFMDYMKNNGIQVSRVHERNDIHTVFSPYKRILPGVSEFMSEMICIPIHYNLTNDEQTKVVETIKDFR